MKKELSFAFLTFSRNIFCKIDYTVYALWKDKGYRVSQQVWKFRWQIIIGRNRCIYFEHLHPCTTFRSKRISCLFCQIASFQGSFLWCKSRLTAHFITFRVEVGEEVLFLTKDFLGYSSLHIYFGASSCSWKGQHMFRCTFLVDALKEEIRHIVALVLLKSSTS